MVRIVHQGKYIARNWDQSPGHYEFQRCIATRAAWTMPQDANPTSLLDRYIGGWAETDLEKILKATAPSYRFTDPFVGSFDARSLHKYFDLVQDRLSCTGAISRRELAFFLQGPMNLRSPQELQFWREAPRIGLTGVAEIEIGEQGVVAERVAYDLNLASDMLCRTDRSRIGRRNGRSGHASGSG